MKNLNRQNKTKIRVVARNTGIDVRTRVLVFVLTTTVVLGVLSIVKLITQIQSG